MVPSRFFVRGLHFRQDTVRKFFAEYDTTPIPPVQVRLVQVDDNEYDPHAVRVEVPVAGEYQGIGWVPRELCPYLRRLMEETVMVGYLLDASAQLSPKFECWMEVEVYLSNYLPRQGKHWE